MATNYSGYSLEENWGNGNGSGSGKGARKRKRKHFPFSSKRIDLAHDLEGGETRVRGFADELDV